MSLSWTKAKSGPTFESMKHRISLTNTHLLAFQYCHLQQTIVKSQLARLQVPTSRGFEALGTHDSFLAPSPLLNEARSELGLGEIAGSNSLGNLDYLF